MADAPLQRLRPRGNGLCRRRARVVKRARAQRELCAQRKRIYPVPMALQAAHQMPILAHADRRQIGGLRMGRGQGSGGHPMATVGHGSALCPVPITILTCAYNLSLQLGNNLVAE